MARITASAPVLLVRDVVASAHHYRDVAGFEVVQLYGEPAEFAICRRDDHYLMLARTDPIHINPHWQIRKATCNAYFWVDDADGLHAEMKAAGATIDYGPCTQPFGVREFGIRDLDGYDISFGQILKG